MNKDCQSLIIKTTVEQGGNFSLEEKELRTIPEGLDSVSEGLQGVESISICWPSSEARSKDQQAQNTCSEVEVAQSYLTLCDPIDYTVHEILQARILEWVGFPFSRGMFPTQRSNPGLPHFRQTLYQLSQNGSPEDTQCLTCPVFESRERTPEPRKLSNSSAEVWWGRDWFIVAVI